MDITETVGYIAMAIVLISFTMKDIKMLRIVNILGCCFFVIYGILLKTSWPIIVTNTAIAMINFYYLVRFKNNNPKKN
ncbi:MAG: uroporphyrinogen decarboxylase [Flavobacteriales bacterium]